MALTGSDHFANGRRFKHLLRSEQSIASVHRIIVRSVEEPYRRVKFLKHTTAIEYRRNILHDNRGHTIYVIAYHTNVKSERK